MNVHSKKVRCMHTGNWKVQTPMNTVLDQKIIDYMIAYVTQATGVVAPGTLEFDENLNPVHLLEKEKEFKYVIMNCVSAHPKAEKVARFYKKMGFVKDSESYIAEL